MSYANGQPTTDTEFNTLVAQKRQLQQQVDGLRLELRTLTENLTGLTPVKIRMIELAERERDIQGVRSEIRTVKICITLLTEEIGRGDSSAMITKLMFGGFTGHNNRPEQQVSPKQNELLELQAMTLPGLEDRLERLTTARRNTADEIAAPPAFLASLHSRNRLITQLLCPKFSSSIIVFI